MTRLQLRILLSVGFAQFFAGFCTLGLAPFFALLLSSLKVESGADRFLLAVGSAGMLYHFPNFCGAWTAPFWGRLGDRYGRKPLLLRAQIGLFLAFGMAALSTHLWQFVLALGLQGLLGGTYAATRAYLAEELSGPELAHSFTWLEAAPRLAWCLGPLGIGWFFLGVDLRDVYRRLLFLPLIAVVLTISLPNSKKRHSREKIGLGSVGQVLKSPASVSWFSRIFGVQFFWSFGGGMITPFFIQFFENKNIGSVECALLFAAPHLVYLMTAPQLGKWVLRNELSVLPLLAISFLLQAGFVFALAFADRLSTALILRLGFGFFMTLALVCFHEWMSRLAKEGLSAEGFGRLDSISRFCGIAGGALVGLATLRAVPAAPFYLGSLSFLVAAAIATLDFEGIFWGRNVELISRARSYPKLIELCSKGDAG